MKLMWHILIVVTLTLTPGCGGDSGEETPTDLGTPDSISDVEQDATTGDDDLSQSDTNDADEPDVDEDVELDIAGDLPEVTEQGGLLKVKVDGKYLTAGYYELPSVVPGVLAEARVKVQISNEGSLPLTIDGLAFQPYNDDGSPKSVWVSLDYLGLIPASVFPVKIAPQSQDPSSVFTVEVVYAPKAFDINASTLKVLTDDSTTPELKIRFLTPPVAPKVRVEPPSAVFEKANLSKYEERIFRIFNDGVVPLKFVKLVFAEPTEVFNIFNQPGWGGQVPPPGSPDYKPINFTVRYQPVFGSVNDKNVLLLYTNDPNNNPVSIPLDSTFETDQDTSPCILIPPSQDLDYVDFSETTNAPETKFVTMKNVGKQVCTLNSVDIPNDPNGIWYTFELLLPAAQEGGPNEPVQELPISFGSGKSVLIQLTYKPQGTGLDADLLVDFEDPDPTTSILKITGGGPKAVFDYAPGPPEAPIMLQYAGTTQSKLERKVAVYNTGNADLLIDSLSMSNNETPDLPSNNWSLKGFFAFPIKVKPNRIKTFSIEMNTGFEPGTIDGTLAIQYLANTGQQILSVPLQGIISNNPPTLPKANPGVTDDYPGLVAEQPFTLKATSTGNVSPGDGYIWYLISKPANSTLVLNGQPGPPNLEVTADKAGVYSFGLIVKSNDPTPMYSPDNSVIVAVEPPPEPEPEPEENP